MLHPGEMGSAVGRTLVSNGHPVGWLPRGRGAATARRARDAGFVDLHSLDDVDIVISLCPPAAALETARSVTGRTGRTGRTGFAGTYVDANAISPQHAREVAALVDRYVDASVIGPPPRERGTTRLYLAGDEADRIAALFDGSALDAVTLADAFAASALKMSYASWTKISSALLLTAHEAARRLGVGDALAREWALSLPELAARHDRALASAEAKGWRWAGEMREIAATMAALELPDGFGAAAADLFGNYKRTETPERPAEN